MSLTVTDFWFNMTLREPLAACQETEQTEFIRRAWRLRTAVYRIFFNPISYSSTGNIRPAAN
jgi:hypothetical protein